VTEAFSVRRMLIALDASPAARGALGLALRLAERLEAEAESLFVEDARLMALCGGLPTAHVSAATGRPLAVDARLMESALRAQAATLTADLDRLAQGLKRRCRLRAVRGPVAETLIAEAAGADLLVLSRRLRHVGAVLEATARRSTASVLVLPDRPEPGDGGAIVLARDQALLELAVVAARRLAGGSGRTADLWLGPDVPEAAAREAAAAAGLAVHAIAAAPATAAAFSDRAPASASLSVLAADDPILSDGGMRDFLARVSTPVLLIRRPAAA